MTQLKVDCEVVVVFFFGGGGGGGRGGAGGGGGRSPNLNHFEPIFVITLLVNIKILSFHWMSNLHMHIFKCLSPSQHFS